jgi:hypothetical protein
MERAMGSDPRDPTYRPPKEEGTTDEADAAAPMGQQEAAELQALCAETGRAFDPSLSRAEAAQLIAELKTLSPRLQRE